LIPFRPKPKGFQPLNDRRRGPQRPQGPERKKKAKDESGLPQQELLQKNSVIEGGVKVVRHTHTSKKQ